MKITIKKLIPLALCLFLLVCGCGGKSESLSSLPSVGPSNPSNPSTPTPPTTPPDGTTPTPSPMPIDADHAHDYPARSNTVYLSDVALLDQSDTNYVLTNDIVADGTAITISAGNVTLDLNGFTVTYGGGGGTTPAYGIQMVGYNKADVIVTNGRVVQASAALVTDLDANGVERQARWHALNFFIDVDNLIVSGVEMVYRTPDTSGVYAPYCPDADIHGNTIIDEGNIVTNRHQMVSAIDITRSFGALVHDNTFHSIRQSAISIGEEAIVNDNVINIDSAVTNSYGIFAYEMSGFIFHSNTISGVGVHPVGIGMVSNVANGLVYNNIVEVQNTRMGDEYGSTPAAALRTTWGADNILVRDNYFRLNAEKNLMDNGTEDSWGRALWVGLPEEGTSMTFRNNIIEAINQNDGAKAAAVAVVCFNRSGDLVFENNEIVSNWGPVLLSDGYGSAEGFAKFIKNTIRKVGSDPSYATVKGQNPSIVSTAIFADNVYEGGAAAEDIDMIFTHAVGSGWYDNLVQKELGFGHLITVNVTDSGQPAADVAVEIEDYEGNVVYTGTTDEDGKLTTALAEYMITNRPVYPDMSAITFDYLPTVTGANRIDLGAYRVIATFSSGATVYSEPFLMSVETVVDLSN